jgi:hypothetical protein
MLLRDERSEITHLLATNIVHFMTQIIFTTKYTKGYEDIFFLIILRGLRDLRHSNGRMTLGTKLRLDGQNLRL